MTQQLKPGQRVYKAGVYCPPKNPKLGDNQRIVAFRQRGTVKAVGFDRALVAFDNQTVEYVPIKELGML